MKKNIITTVITLGFLMNLSSVSLANNSEFEFSGNVGFVSDYIFRGISQSDNNFSVQGGFDAEHRSGLYLGAWASSIDFDDDDQASAEVDVYAGYGFSFKGLSFDLGAVYYAYPDADDALDYNFYELYAGVSKDIDKLELGGSINYTPENFGETGDATYLALHADYQINDSFNFHSNIGYQMIDDDISFGTDDYLHWGAGFGYSFEGFDFNVKYLQSDLDTSGRCGSSCDPKFTIGVSRSF